MQNSQTVTYNMKTQNIITSISESTICPVRIYQLYMTKLHPESDFLWQRPKKKVSNKDPVWYDNSPVGRDPLNNAMKTLSKNAGLSQQYRNHSIRATVVTNLDKEGFEARHIMATTGHKSETSIKNYARKCPTRKRREISDALANSMMTDLQNNNENTPKKPKREIPATATRSEETNELINMPDFNLAGADLETIDDKELSELFAIDENVMESQEVMDLVAQIEQENSNLAVQATTPQTPKTPKTPKTYNFANISNIANVNRMPLMPHMLFPHSNVTINYNFNK